MAEQAEPVEVAGRPLKCTVCGHDRFWSRRAQLHSAGATFFGLEWAQPSADCFICGECRHILWFYPRS